MLNIDIFFNLFFPYECRNCGKIGTILCERCKNQLIPSIPTCYYCNKVSNKFLSHDKCLEGSKIQIIQSFSCWKYNSLASNILKSYKFKSAYTYANFISDLMIKRLSVMNNFITDRSYIIPIPLSSKRKRARGYNQTELIADNLAKHFNCISDKHYAIQENFTSSSTFIKLKSDRQKNIVKKFKKISIRNISGSIIIFDDVITTGNTMNSFIKQIFPNIQVKVLSIFNAR